VPNVGKVNLIGAEVEAIFLEFSTREMAALGISQQDVIQTLQNARRPRAEDEFLGVELRADGRRHRVRVDVEQRAVLVRGERAHDRHEAVVEQLADHRGVHAHDVTNEAVVRGLPVIVLHRRAPVRADEPRVHAADAYRVDVETAADGKDARVDEPAQHHGGDVDGLRVRDAPAVHHARFHAQRGLQLRHLRAAAVNHDDAHAEVVEDGDLLHEHAGGFLVCEHATASLHDKGLALVHADVGRGALQCADGQGLIGTIHHLQLPLSSL
jgi:hypothetical protein